MATFPIWSIYDALMYSTRAVAMALPTLLPLNQLMARLAACQSQLGPPRALSRLTPTQVPTSVAQLHFPSIRKIHTHKISSFHPFDVYFNKIYYCISEIQPFPGQPFLETQFSSLTFSIQLLAAIQNSHSGVAEAIFSLILPPSDSGIFWSL